MSLFSEIEHWRTVAEAKQIKIESLRRQVAEQKEKIDSDYFALACVEYRQKLTEQSALIEKLKDALEHHQKLTRPIERSYEALAAYEEWKK